MLALGANGNCMIVGRGARFVLPDASTFRVRLMAPLDDRVDARRLRLDTVQYAARSSVQAEDRERIRFVRNHFHRDSEAVEHYDLILNVARLSPDARAGLITDGLRRRQIPRNRPATEKND